MDLADLMGVNILGLGLVVLFLLLILLFSVSKKSQARRKLRDIPVFAHLRRGIGLAVETGTRLHVTLGHGGILGIRGASGLVGLSLLQRVSRVASISDRPPVSTSGDGVLSLLSQDTIKTTLHSIGAAAQFFPGAGQLTGLTPFSYAAGAAALIREENVSVNVLAGSFGAEVALITEASERSGGITLAGSDNLVAQAVLYLAAQEPLIGEELYAVGAYIQTHPVHVGSLRAQDVIRWVLIVLIIIGAILKLVGG